MERRLLRVFGLPGVEIVKEAAGDVRSDPKNFFRIRQICALSTMRLLSPSTAICFFSLNSAYNLRYWPLSDENFEIGAIWDTS